MLFRFHPQQVGAQERAGNEIEGANSLLVYEPAGLFFSLFFGNCCEIELLQFQLGGRMDDLHRRGVFDDKRRAQRFVAARISVKLRSSAAVSRGPSIWMALKML